LINLYYSSSFIIIYLILNIRMLRAFTSGFVISGICFYNYFSDNKKNYFCNITSSRAGGGINLNPDVNKTYYKVLKKDMKHFGHLYKLGINEDKIQFDPHEICGPGGLYFCNFEDVVRWLTIDDDNEYIAEIKLLEDSKVVEQSYKFKTNKFVVQNLVLITDFLEKNNLEEKAVANSGLALKYVKNQTPELCLMATSQYSSVVKDIVNPTPELLLDIVKRQPYSIYYIKNQTPELCLTAVKEKPRTLPYIRDLSVEICEAAFSSFKDINYNTENSNSLMYPSINKCKVMIARGY